MFTLGELSNYKQEKYKINKTHPLVHGKKARLFSTGVGAAIGGVASGLTKNKYAKAGLIGGGALLGAFPYHNMRQRAYSRTRKNFNKK